MALVIETGDGIPGANSYIDEAYATAYAIARGVQLPSDNALLDPLIVQACDYLETFRDQYIGVRASGRQSLSWPRGSVIIDGSAYAVNELPELLKQAQAQAVIEVSTNGDLTPSVTGYAVRMEKVDVIQVEYASGGGGTASQPTKPVVPSFPKIEALLDPLLRNGGQVQLQVIRA